MTSRIGNRLSSGFTLVEVLLSVVILSLGIISVLRAYSASLEILGATEFYIEGTILAKEKMLELEQEELENAGLSPGGAKKAFLGEGGVLNGESQISGQSKYLSVVTVTVFNPSREIILSTYAQNKE